jgi:dUTP pyrophosphatase
MQVKIKKLHTDAVIPKYAKEGDAGMDLTAVTILEQTPYSVTYDTGLAFEIPEGFVGYIFPRSSIRKYGLLLSNSVGVVDSGYRGSVQATFKRTGHIEKYYSVGDRIAQIIIMPIPYINFVEAEELSSTERGTGGFGSTGK